MNDMAREPRVDPPRGLYPARVDDKGRLKLPAQFCAYLQQVSDRFFVTCLDGRTAVIYPRQEWARRQALLHSQAESSPSNDRAAESPFLASQFGSDAGMDSMGRILLPPEVRIQLDLTDQQVYLQWDRGGVEVWPQSVFEERRKRALANVEPHADYAGNS
jgi:MraZ protein